MASDENLQDSEMLSADARENRCIALAIDLAEKQLREGTASAQVIAHYLKLGSSRERLEKERLKRQTEMLEEKAKTFQSMQNTEELYREAVEAMKKYSGS